MRNLKTWSTLLLALLVSGCGFVHDEHIVGPYRLIAVDIDEQMSINYELDGGSAVGWIQQTVFAYGFNSRYIVAKQHPENNRRVTNYFYLDMTKDSKYAEPTDSVTGPLSQRQFVEETKRLGLPKFKRELKALK